MAVETAARSTAGCPPLTQPTPRTPPSNVVAFWPLKAVSATRIVRRRTDVETRFSRQGRTEVVAAGVHVSSVAASTREKRVRRVVEEVVVVVEEEEGGEEEVVEEEVGEEEEEEE